MTEYCENCRFCFAPYHVDRKRLEEAGLPFERVCRRFKLMPVVIDNATLHFPPVFRDYWCGEYQPKEQPHD